MENRPPDCNLSEEDLREAIREMKTYVDVTEEDLKKIFEIALRHAQERAALHMPVRDVMTKRVVTISRTADIHEAARLLSENRVSGMPVVDDRNVVIGVISEADILMLAGLHEGHTFRDILHRIMGEPVPARKAGNTVGQVMSFPPITSKADDDVSEVAKLLDERRIKRLPVVDDEGRLIGIISRADIVRAIGKMESRG
ncbi:MAG TPA: CBS domain-containing protein [Nitrospirota bacterium]|nr:CBS domain-containing protein [Nitrospirota bacterium]